MHFSSSLLAFVHRHPMTVFPENPIKMYDEDNISGPMTKEIRTCT